MTSVDIAADQFLCLMQHNTGFCRVPHTLGRLKKGDAVEFAGFKFVVFGVVEGSVSDQVWLKKG